MLKLFDSYLQKEQILSEAEGLFEKPVRGDWKDRFQIYFDGFDIRSRLALEEAFPKTKNFIEASLWSHLGYHYVRKYPSQHFDLGQLGKDFPNYLLDQGVSAEIAEFARLEWSLHRIFHAESGVVNFSEEDLSKIDENSTFDFFSNFQLWHSNFNILSVWDGSESKIKKDSEWGILFRENFQPCVEKLEVAAFCLIEDLQQGKSLGELQIESSEELMRVLQKLFQRSCVKSIGRRNAADLAE